MLHNLAKTLKVIHSLCNLAKKAAKCFQNIFIFGSYFFITRNFLPQHILFTNFCWVLWRSVCHSTLRHLVNMGGQKSKKESSQIRTNFQYMLESNSKGGKWTKNLSILYSHCVEIYAHNPINQMVVMNLEAQIRL